MNLFYILQHPFLSLSNGIYHHEGVKDGYKDVWIGDTRRFSRQDASFAEKVNTLQSEPAYLPKIGSFHIYRMGFCVLLKQRASDLLAAIMMWDFDQHFVRQSSRTGVKQLNTHLSTAR